jgi:2-keto-3-deoxy-L-rhamnonate aldolase RhmA
MLRENTLKRRLQAGEATIGSWLSVAHPTIAEVMGQAGFDWLIVDMEHGIVGLEAIQNLIIATQTTPAAPLVRVPWNEPVIIKQVLEAGPVGLIIPQVTSAEEARAAVRSASYPPAGIRGIGCQRAAGFGAWFAEYLQRANDDLLIGVQIEHTKAVENIDEIVRVPGVNLVFIGANDLSASMGLLGEPKHPRVQEAIDTVLAAAKKVGIAAGLVAYDSQDADRRIAQGFQFVAIGHDVGLLSLICRRVCDDVKALNTSKSKSAMPE